MAQHRCESRFLVLIIFLEQVLSLCTFWPTLPAHPLFLNAMLQDCLTWAQARVRGLFLWIGQYFLFCHSLLRCPSPAPEPWNPKV